MMLSLSQVAARIGKSERQVRYLIQAGKIPARKLSGRWLIDSDDLPLSGQQQKVVERKERQLRAAVDEGLGLAERRQPRYSVRDLKAFQIALPLHATAAAELGEHHPAAVALHEVLLQLSRGCHRFERTDKADAYGAARDAASRAVCELALVGTDKGSGLLRAIEQDLMAAIAGLLRRLARPPR